MRVLSIAFAARICLYASTAAAQSFAGAGSASQLTVGDGPARGQARHS